jgi:lipid A 3-O-deacylase
MRRCLLVLLAPLPAVLQAGAARADGIFSEVRLGALAHDPSELGGKEHGTDINGELLFVSPVADGFIAPLPVWLRWVLQPRAHIGIDQNLDSYTSQYYFGATWTATLTRQVLKPSDSVFLGLGFGPALNNGHATTTLPDRQSLGSNVLFQLSADLGYQITPRWSAMLYFDHSSNGHLADHNQSLNNIGLRVGLRF